MKWAKGVAKMYANMDGMNLLQCDESEFVRRSSVNGSKIYQEVRHLKGHSRIWKPRPLTEGWVVRYPRSEVAFDYGIPTSLPYHDLEERLGYYLEHPVGVDGGVMIVIGAPGSGKSTTVANSLSYHGYMRVRVTEQTGAMATLQRNAAELCASFSKSGYMTREVLEAKLVSCCEQALATLFSQFQARASILRTSFVGLLTGNVEPRQDYISCLDLAINELCPNEVLLIHIDDVQGWSAPAGYKCRKDAPLYDLSEWPKYAFMVLARLLSDLVARESKLRVVFSGTDYLVADALFHATEEHSPPKPIPPMPTSAVRRLFGSYFDLQLFSETEVGRVELPNIIEQVSYNPKMLQFFLDEATSRLMDTKTHETAKILAHLRSAMECAYSFWAKGVDELAGNGAESSMVKWQLALAFMYPEAAGAVPGDDEGIQLSPSRDLEKPLLKHYRAGLFHVHLYRSNSLLVMKPRGHMARYLLTRPQLSEGMAYMCFRAMPLQRAGHPVATVIAAEFAIPNSPLYQRLFSALEDDTLQADPGLAFKQILESSKLGTETLQRGQVACSSAKSERKIDITVPLLNKELVCFAVMNEAKGSPVLRRALAFFSYIKPAIDDGTVRYAVMMNAQVLPKKTKYYQKLKAWLDIRRADGTRPYAILTPDLQEELFAGCFFPVKELFDMSPPEQLQEEEERANKRKRDEEDNTGDTPNSSDDGTKARRVEEETHTEPAKEQLAAQPQDQPTNEEGKQIEALE